MLSEYRKSYEILASQIPGWKYLSKSDLCYKYIEYENSDNMLANYYLAGLLAKYMKKAESEYHNQVYKYISEDDYYDLIIQSVLYVIDKRVWENKNSKLYKNKDGPEIAINQSLKTSKINMYIFMQRDKRKLNINSVSLDSLEETTSDGFFIPYHDADISTDLYIGSLIKDYFNKKQYLNAFLLDSIMNKNVFVDKNNQVEFNLGKLKSSIKNIDKDYCKIFSQRYQLKTVEVENAISYFNNINYSKLDSVIKKLFNNLRKDKELLSILYDVY